MSKLLLCKASSKYFDPTNLSPQLIKVKIQLNSCYCGMNVAAIPMPENCVVIGIIRSGEFIATNSEVSINCGDIILALALQPCVTPILKYALEQTHPVTWSTDRCSLPEWKQLSVLNPE